MPTPVSPKITDHSDRAIARLLGFVLESPNFNKLVRAATVGTQNMEDVLDDLINKQAISTAEGVQLDNIGTILDLERASGQSDAEYRALLQTRAVNLSSSGTWEILIGAYIRIWSEIGVAQNVWVEEYSPATAELAIEIDTSTKQVGKFSFGDFAEVDVNHNGPSGNATYGGFGNYDDNSIGGELWTAFQSFAIKSGIEIILAMGESKAAGVNLILEASDATTPTETDPAITPQTTFRYGDVADVDVNGDLPNADYGFSDVVNIDSNGDIPSGDGGGNFVKLIE